MTSLPAHPDSPLPPDWPTLIFDIETGPALNAAEILRPEPFDPATVALGNAKDPEKIAARIEAARQKHAEGGDDKDALRGITARVMAIGYQWTPGSVEVVYGLIEGGPRLDEHDCAPAGVRLSAVPDEAELLHFWWQRCAPDAQGRLPLIIGFNSHGFDLPILIQRSIVHGVAVPPLFGGGYWSPYSIDLKEVWSMRAGPDTARGNLDQLSRLLGGPGKNGHGADFSAKWNGTLAEQLEEVEYLANDIRMTAQVWHAARAALPLPLGLATKRSPYWDPWPRVDKTRDKQRADGLRQAAQARREDLAKEELPL
jgi:hypothetical protein